MVFTSGLTAVPGGGVGGSRREGGLCLPSEFSPGENLLGEGDRQKGKRPTCTHAHTHGCYGSGGASVCDAEAGHTQAFEDKHAKSNGSLIVVVPGGHQSCCLRVVVAFYANLRLVAKLLTLRVTKINTEC